MRTSAWQRVLQGAIGILGIVAILATGGGGGGPGTECSFFSSTCNPAPVILPPSVSISPGSSTVQVGTGVTFTATTANFTTSNFVYSWCRIAPGSEGPCVELAGVSGERLDLVSVNLPDDGARFRVTATSSPQQAVSALATLYVSSMPGVVYSDGEFVDADWVVTGTVSPATAGSFEVSRAASGGNPGAYRAITYELSSPAITVRTFHLALGANYYPTSQGEIYRIEFGEDCLSAARAGYPAAQPLIEQGGRRFVAPRPGACDEVSWIASRRPSLSRADFSLEDGPACAAGESCPDFSANAAPLRFGFRSGIQVPVSTLGGARTVHRVDNWRVTVWRR